MLRKTPLKRSTKPMARSGFKHKAALKAGTKRLRARKVPPTAEEREWMAKIAEFGCIVCYLFHHARTPAAVHHIVEGGRRIGHLWTIPLCDPGHHQGATKDSGKISRHPDKARFEQARH